MLNLNDSVYAFATEYDSIYINKAGNTPVDRGYVTRVHDDFVEVFSLISQHRNWYRRDRVVSTKRLNVGK